MSNSLHTLYTNNFESLLSVSVGLAQYCCIRALFLVHMILFVKVAKVVTFVLLFVQTSGFGSSFLRTIPKQIIKVPQYCVHQSSCSSESESSADIVTEAEGTCAFDPDAELKITIESLRANITAVEQELRDKKTRYAQLQKAISESGKNGYYLVQAQVSNYLVRSKFSICTVLKNIIHYLIIDSLHHHNNCYF